ncbi:MAG: proteasome, alpha and beta subunit [Gemmatimonadetes bacterium]|nr:proteasome, alpha and beta subunit [Gemmatimonadota bacterium]
MTVCVATMSNGGGIYCAADRMLTRGITQTEPASPKIYHFAGPLKTVVMWSGSSTTFGEVIQTALLRAEKTKYSTIKEYVDLYCNCFSAMQGERAERAILTPLGLTRASLVSSKVSNDRARDLVDMITTFALPDEACVSVIIAGFDADGPHIWAVHNNVPYCHDVEGFAAVGSGADHADSQLRFAGFTRRSVPSAALILAFLAKKRAEIAPGVGRATDMSIMAPTAPPFSVPAEWIARLEKEYEDFARSEKTALNTAIDQGMTVLQTIVASMAPAPTQEAVSQPPSAVSQD